MSNTLHKHTWYYMLMKPDRTQHKTFVARKRHNILGYMKQNVTGRLLYNGLHWIALLRWHVVNMNGLVHILFHKQAHTRIPQSAIMEKCATQQIRTHIRFTDRGTALKGPEAHDSLTLLQCLPIPMRKLSGLMSR